MVKGWTKRALWAVPAALLAGFAAYEGFAVARAKARTPLILRQVVERPVALTLEAVPRRRVEMLLAVEDPGFRRHKGLDFSTPGQGMTSLTQALVKMLYFHRFEPGLAKIEQSLIARFVLHSAMSKHDQLELFLNRARFGRRGGKAIEGFPDAARAFYNTQFHSLSDDQYLSLVAMLISPREFDPVRQPAANAERVRRIKSLLAGRCRPRGLKDVRYDSC